MRSSSTAILFLWLLHRSSSMVIDTTGISGNLSLYVDYSGLDEEDKKYTLEKLTADTDFEDEAWTKTPEAESPTTTERIFANQTSAREARILPATAAVAGQFPYFVYVMATQKDGSTIVHCGGSLLSDTWVLTAAQCVATASSIKVIAGLIASTTTTPASTGIATIHPCYKRNFLIHDIALIRLQTPFTFGSTIYPIKLAKKDHTHTLDAVTLRTVGFGPADDTTTLGTPLNYVDLVQLSKAACVQQTSEIFISYPAHTACLSTSTSTRGFCYGDTGGPVVYTYPNEVAVTLIGINSQYQACPSAYPMTYTRVAPYLGWIKTKVKKLLT